MNTETQSGRRAVAALALMLLAAGCSVDDGRPETYPASGSVTFRGDPADGAIVALHPRGAEAPDDLRPRGEVGLDGTFLLGTFDADDGAPAGDYAVTVFWPDDSPGPPGPRPDRLDGRYNDPSDPEWTARIEPGENDLETFRIE